MRSLLKRILFLTLLALLPAGFTSADSTQILVQSTTSTQNSGLYDFILPVFEAETGYEVNVVAVGTGQAIRNAQNGDADVLLVHSTASEKEFVSQGFGVKRFDLMYNDFVIIGPLSDPAGLKYSTKLGTALEAILSTGIPFVSRGDDSGTHKKENSLWKSFQHNPDKFGSWYTETGSGMGATIRMAVELNGYTLTDRATWIAYKNKANHQVVFEGDPNLFNQYGVIAVNPVAHPHVNHKGANDFITWLLSDRGQRLIAKYIVQDQQLFFTNAGKTVVSSTVIQK